MYQSPCRQVPCFLNYSSHLPKSARCYFYLTDEETETEKLNNLLKVTKSRTEPKPTCLMSPPHCLQAVGKLRGEGTRNKKQKASTLPSHAQAMKQVMVSALCWFHEGGMQRNPGPPASDSIREDSLAHPKSPLGSENPRSASRGGAQPELRPAGQLHGSGSWSPVFSSLQALQEEE